MVSLIKKKITWSKNSKKCSGAMVFYTPIFPTYIEAVEDDGGWRSRMVRKRQAFCSRSVNELTNGLSQGSVGPSWIQN